MIRQRVMKRLMLPRGLWVAILLGMTLLFSPLALHAEDTLQRLTLLHTSDLHGQVLPFDDARNAPTRGSLTRVATVVEAIREESDHPVLLLDSGDTLQGAPLEQFAHVEWGEPSPTIEAMNRIGYQAMAVGNHEFNFGLALLRDAEEQADFPFLSANTIDERTGKPAFPPYLVIEAGPVRVGILGLITPNIPGWEQPANYRGLRFEPMDEAARRWVPVLRDQVGCDLVVVLAHTGFETDLETGESNGTEIENFGWRLSEIEGIDLLLTGHAHHDIEPAKINTAIVSQPRARARLVTRIDLWLAPAGEGWVIDHWEGVNLPVDDVSGDQQLAAAFALLHTRLAEALDEPITSATDPVSVSGCRMVDCTAVDLFHAVQLAASGADLSLASLLTDGTPDLEPGPVTWRWVYGLYVYPNTLQAVEVTGAQVKDILEHAALYYQGLDCSLDSGCRVLTNPAVRSYNVDNVSGLDYRIDPTRPEGDRVRDLRYRGEPLDLHAKFKLVCNNYRAAGGGGYPHLSDASVVWTSSTEVTELIGEYLSNHDPWRPTVDGNWRVDHESASESTVAGDGADSAVGGPRT